MSNKTIYRPQSKTEYSSYLYILPAFIFYILFVLFPLGDTLYTSFTEWNGISEKKWVGFDQYINNLSDKKITTKWFYNYADTEEFKSKFSITIRSLVALKKMKHTKIGLVGGISPGFDNMEVDQSKIKKNLVKEALYIFFDIRKVPGMTKKPSTSELIDWLKLLMADDIPDEIFKNRDLSLIHI